MPGAETIDRVFAQAVKVVQKLPKVDASSRPPLETRLSLYGLFKQATEGDAVGLPRPENSEQAPLSRQKWDAWNECRGLSKTSAKSQYIQLLIRSASIHIPKENKEARDLIGQLSLLWQDACETSYSPSDALGLFAGEEMGTPGLPSRERFYSTRELALGEQSDQEDTRRGEDMETKHEDIAVRPPIAFRTGPPTPAPPPIEDFNQLIWQRETERTLVRIRTELAALREDIVDYRHRKHYRRNSLLRRSKAGRFIMFLIKHFFFDFALVCVFWAVRRKTIWESAARLLRVFRDELYLLRTWLLSIMQRVM